MRRLLIVLTLLAITLAACGPSGTVTDLGAAPSAEPSPAEPSERATAAAERPSHEPVEPAPTARDAAPAATDEDLPGAPVVWAEQLNTAADVGVTGVESDDVLNVRAKPGADQPIVAHLAPLRAGLRLTGAARMVRDSVWLEISTGTMTGWVNSAFVDLVAGTTDITADLRDAGVVPLADTMRDMADSVLAAGGYADGYVITWGPRHAPGVNPEGQRRVVISDGPSVDDLGQITIDVVDLFDDAVAAERLTIFANPSPDGTLALRSVERTQFCHVVRGAGQVCA